MKNFNNIIFDTDYTPFVVGGGFPKIEASGIQNIKSDSIIAIPNPEEKKWFMDKILSFLVPGKSNPASSPITTWTKNENSVINGTLKEKIQKILELK